jgi:hypothetical protein
MCSHKREKRVKKRVRHYFLLHGRNFCLFHNNGPGLGSGGITRWT